MVTMPRRVRWITFARLRNDARRRDDDRARGRAIVGRMTTPIQRLGIDGERTAARWLRRRGWRILDHRWRSGRRDLDLVAAHGDLVAFVEVKARRRNGFGGPIEAVGWRKRRE